MSVVFQERPAPTVTPGSCPVQPQLTSAGAALLKGTTAAVILRDVPVLLSHGPRAPGALSHTLRLLGVVWLFIYVLCSPRMR